MILYKYQQKNMDQDGCCHCQKETIADASGIFDLKSVDHYTGHDDVVQMTESVLLLFASMSPHFTTVNPQDIIRKNTMICCNNCKVIIFSLPSERVSSVLSLSGLSEAACLLYV